MIGSFMSGECNKITIIKQELENHQECTQSHEPNAITKQALKNVQERKNLKKASSIDTLFKELSL